MSPEHHIALLAAEMYAIRAGGPAGAARDHGSHLVAQRPALGPRAGLPAMADMTASAGPGIARCAAGAAPAAHQVSGYPGKVHLAMPCPGLCGAR
jgi:hypothetical protein